MSSQTSSGPDSITGISHRDKRWDRRDERRTVPENRAPPANHEARPPFGPAWAWSRSGAARRAERETHACGAHRRQRAALVISEALAEAQPRAAQTRYGRRRTRRPRAHAGTGDLRLLMVPAVGARGAHGRLRSARPCGGVEECRRRCRRPRSPPVALVSAGGVCGGSSRTGAPACDELALARAAGKLPRLGDQAGQPGSSRRGAHRLPRKSYRSSQD